MSEKPVVFFDGYCKLCSGWVRFLMKNNGEEKFNFVALQSEEGKIALKMLELSTVDLTTIIYRRDNTYYRHSLAVIEILHDLGGPWKSFYIFKLIPAFVRDYLYLSVSKSRYKIFGRNDSCLIPKKNVKKMLWRTEKNNKFHLLQ